MRSLQNKSVHSFGDIYTFVFLNAFFYIPYFSSCIYGRSMGSNASNVPQFYGNAVCRSSCNDVHVPLSVTSPSSCPSGSSCSCYSLQPDFVRWVMLINPASPVCSYISRFKIVCVVVFKPLPKINSIFYHIYLLFLCLSLRTFPTVAP